MEMEARYLMTLEVKDEGFDLEKAVCSHGLFMMSPNLWISSAKTLQRPLRLSNNVDSVYAQISYSSPFLHIWVFGIDSLSTQDEMALKIQVIRMLRISEEEDRKIAEFHRIHEISRDKGFGRIFRSPTLFEDMVKCILLCNCQWTRTLSMAKALCELQFELKGEPLGYQNIKSYLNISYPIAKRSTKKSEKTKRKGKRRRKTEVATQLEDMLVRDMIGKGRNDGTELTSSSRNELNSTILPSSFDICHESNDGLLNDPSLSVIKSCSCAEKIGNFPTPEELAVLDVNDLSRKCNLGYRAISVVKLARSIVKGNLQLGKLEEACDGKQSTYEELAKYLLEVDGFGPFTCSNVLMCMGFYHKVPADTETIRHLKQFHGRKCSIQTVQKNIEEIYGIYSPFQFLVYWSELWNYYEKKFGKLSEMPPSEYQLITASNMRI